MLYDYLIEFTAIARTGSLSKASRELGVSQPALGRHLSALEAELGGPLVTRDTHGITPTAEGRYLLGMGMDIRSIGEEIERHFASARQGRGLRRIYIAGLSTLDTVLDAFQDACGQAVSAGVPIEGTLYRAGEGDRQPARSLATGQADIVVTMPSALEGETSLYVRPLCEAACMALVEPDSHLARKASVSTAELAGVRIARPSGAIEDSDVRWEEYRRHCLAAGFSPLSYTTSFGARPYNGWNLPGCVVLFREDQLNEAAVRRLGKVPLRVEDFAYEICAACREGDDDAHFLVDHAAEALEMSDSSL